MQRHTVHNRGHGVLANTIHDVVAVVICGGNGFGSLGYGQVGGRKVCRTADNFRHMGNNRLQAHLRGFAGGNFGLLGNGGRFEFVQLLVPAFGQFAGNGIKKCPAFYMSAFFPILISGSRTPTGLAPGIEHRGGNLKRRGLPAKSLAHGGNFIGSQRRAVTFRRAAFGRRAEADFGFAGNQGRFFRLLRFFNCFFNLFVIVSVNADCIPADSLKAFDLVGGIGGGDIAVDGDVVIVPKDNHFIELKMPGQRNRLFGNSLHQTAVTVDDIGIMRAEFIAESGVDNPFGQRHAYRRGNALPQRTGGHINTGEVAVFGVAGGFGTKLAEVFDVFNINIRVAQQI